MDKNRKAGIYLANYNHDYDEKDIEDQLILAKTFAKQNGFIVDADAIFIDKYIRRDANFNIDIFSSHLFNLAGRSLRGDFDTLIIMDDSVLSRNRYVSAYIRTAFEENGISIVRVKTPARLEDPESKYRANVDKYILELARVYREELEVLNMNFIEAVRHNEIIIPSYGYYTPECEYYLQGFVDMMKKYELLKK